MEFPTRLDDDNVFVNNTEMHQISEPIIFYIIIGAMMFNKNKIFLTSGFSQLGGEYFSTIPSLSVIIKKGVPTFSITPVWLYLTNFENQRVTNGLDFT